MSLRYGTSNITTYDLVKALAILLTVFDHVGFFFIPMKTGFAS